MLRNYANNDKMGNFIPVEVALQSVTHQINITMYN